MQSREEKFKRLREEISLQAEKEDLSNEIITPEEYASQQDNHLKGNTLKLSINQIIEAHDEYMVVVEQQKAKEDLKRKSKQLRLTKIKLIGKIIGISLVLLLMLIVIIIVIIIVTK